MDAFEKFLLIRGIQRVQINKRQESNDDKNIDDNNESNTNTNTTNESNNDPATTTTNNNTNATDNTNTNNTSTNNSTRPSGTRRSEVIVLNDDAEILSHTINGVSVQNTENRTSSGLVFGPTDHNGRPIFGPFSHDDHHPFANPIEADSDDLFIEEDEDDEYYDEDFEDDFYASEDDMYDYLMNHFTQIVQNSDANLRHLPSHLPNLSDIRRVYGEEEEDEVENEEEEDDEEMGERLEDLFNEDVDEEFEEADAAPTRIFGTIEMTDENTQHIRDMEFLSSTDEERGIVIDEDDDSDPDGFYNSRRESFTTNNTSQINEYEKRLDISFEDKNYRYFEKPISHIKLNLPSKYNVSNFIFNSKQKPHREVVVRYPSANIYQLLTYPPAATFPDSIQMFSVGSLNLKNFEKSKRYKNNLSTNIIYRNQNFLLLGTNSKILIYKYDPITNLPFTEPCMEFNTKPSYTTNADRLTSTWPYFPHTINYIKSGEFNGIQIVCACIDDGFLLIWEVDTLFQYITNDKKIDKKNSPNFDKIIKPKYKIKFSASLWGLDFKDNIIVASDNSQSCVLLYYHKIDEKFYHIKTHQVLHNIPDVSIINMEKGLVQVSCASISGELVIFEFKFHLIDGPICVEELEYNKKKQLYYVDPIVETMENQEQPRSSTFCDYNLKRVKFLEPIVISRTVLGEDCWTVNKINSKWFLPVNSLQQVFGNSSLDEWKENNRIINESLALDNNHDSDEEIEGKKEIKSQNYNTLTNLGRATDYQFFESRTVDLSGFKNKSVDIAKFTNVNDEYRRLHKQYISESDNVIEKNRDLLVVSTGKKLGLFNVPSLYCKCATKSIFNYQVPDVDEISHSNRLSIVAIIPEISCVLAVSQLGLISIMRLCTFKGVYGMRQEFVFPNVSKLLYPEGSPGVRTIIGITTRKKFQNEEIYSLNVIYDDGLILAYDLLTFVRS
ncbi:uncharacterized protein KGF55_002990 [Candida pseudojiufengensis]|uniref:uncharacterized protein n=1 Tax=Candida pseudojiufengensis TaxID=497109 RepID=UPI0022241B62|nr:uncharacterized protein KGF55_002990 [Candida pseudojiufengensis]KAI5963198.1 hypothetical protein KGF55_002990 [Candida pseudojiufengensis]